jgi:hypothetical protein
MRLTLAVTLTLFGCCLFLAGCSEQGTANQAANAPIKVQTSPMFVTIKNDSGIPFTDVTITIVPPTRITVYTSSLGRLENAESRDVMLGDFRGRDGTPFNLRVANPKSVEVKGTGADGKAYDVSVPWK